MAAAPVRNQFRDGIPDGQPAYAEPSSAHVALLRAATWPSGFTQPDPHSRVRPLLTLGCCARIVVRPGGAVMNRTVTLPDGTQVPALGVGTWRMGERAGNRRHEVDAVRTALKLGYRLIDSAEMYGNGGAEEIVGEAL